MQHHRHRFTLLLATFTLGLAPGAYAAVNIPAITSVVATSAPNTPITTAPAGTSIQVNGQNFGPTVGFVLFGSHAAAVSGWSDTRIQATVPQVSSYPYQGQV